MTDISMTDEQHKQALHYADMRDRQLHELRTRAAIRVAARLGAGVDELHDVMLAMRYGWTPEVDKYRGEELGEILLDTCDENWREHRAPCAPERSRHVLELLGEMWPDVVAECELER